MSKKYPDNPIVGILAKAIKQEWANPESASSPEPPNTRDEINELRYKVLTLKERISSLESRIEFLMELTFQQEAQNIPKKKDNKGKKIKLPFPTTYVSYKPPVPTEENSDDEGGTSQNAEHHEDTQSE